MDGVLLRFDTCGPVARDRLRRRHDAAEFSAAVDSTTAVAAGAARAAAMWITAIAVDATMCAR